MAAGVPNSSDINNIMASAIAQNDAAIQMANLMQKSSVKLGDIKSLEYSVMQLDGVNRVIGAYTSTLASIVQSLVNIDDQINIREVSILEKTLQQVDKDGKITDKGGELKILKVVNDVNKMMSVVLDNSVKLGEKDLGFFALRRAKKNIAQSRVMLEETVSAMMSVLNSMVHNPTVLANLDVFGDIEEEVKENNELVIGKDSESKQYSITKKRAGILSIMNQLLSMVNTVSQFNPPSRFEMWIRLRKFKRALSQTTDMLIGCINDTMLKEGAVLGEEQQKLINGQIDIIIKFSEGITKIIDSLAKTSTGIDKKQDSIKILLELWYNPNEDKKFAIYNFLYDFVKSEKFKVITKDKKSILSNLETVEKIVESFKNITKNLILVGLMSVVIWATQKMISVTIDVLANVITKLAQLDNKAIVGACNNIESLMSITKRLTAASLLLLGLSILVMPALLGVLATILLLQSLSFVLNALGSKSFTQDVKQASKNILKLLIVFGSLFLVAGAILLFGEFVLEFWKPLLGGLIATLVLLGSVWLMFFIIDKIGKSGLKSILSLIIITIAMTLIVGITALILLVAQMAEGISWEAFGKIAAILGGFILIIVLAGVLSSIIITGAVVMILVAMAMVLMVLPLVMLFGVLKMMESFDATTAMENLKVVLTGFITTIGSLFTPANLLGIMLAMVSMVPLTLISISLIAVISTMLLIHKIMEENPNIEGSMSRIGPMLSNFINVITENISLKTVGKLMLALPAMAMIGMIALSLSAVAYTIQSFANLSIPTKYDKDGNPVEFRQMNQADFDFASSNMVNIMTTLIKAISDPELVKQIDDMGVLAIAKIGFILSVVGNLKNIVEVIQQMSHMSVATKFDSNGNPIEFKSVTPEERDAAIATTISLMTDLLKAMTSEELTSQLDDMGRRSRKNLETIMSSTGGVKDLVDAIKTAATFKEGEVANGIGTIRSLIVEYAGLMSELFVNKWDWVWKKKKVFGINVPYLTFEVVDKAQIDVDSLDDAVDGMTELLKPLDPTKQLTDKIKEMLKDADYTTMPPQLDAMKNSILDYVAIVTNKRLLLIDFSKSSEKLTMLSGITDQVKPLIDKLNDMSQNYDFLGIQKDVDELGKTIIAYTEIFTGNSKGEGGINISSIGLRKFKMFQKLVKEQQKFAEIDTKRLSESTEQFIKVFDKINTLDNDKIKSTADMFAQMTKLSKSIRGNFEGLAEALNENLMEVLEELRDILEQTNGIIESRPSSSSPMQMPQIQNISSASQNTVPQEVPQQEAPQKPVDMTPVIEKLEGLLQAFKGGVPVYNKVGTRLQINTTV